MLFNKDIGSFYKKAVNVFLLLLVLSPFSAVATDTETEVFVPRVYERLTGSPRVEIEHFNVSNPGATYLLKIFNGGLEDDVYELVSSSIIYLNGVEILSPNELNQHVTYIEKTVTVQSVNELSVEVRGKPGGALVIGVYGINLNQPPVANNQAVTTDEDASAAIALSASDINADALTYVIVNQPLHGTLSGVSPNLTYTPATNFNGTDSFTFKANDGLLDSAIATVSINVTAANDAPIAFAQVITTNEDVAASVVLSGSDIDGDALTFSVSIQPINGVLSGVSPNLSYTPNANFNGTDSFSFTANDGVLVSSVEAVSITVVAANDAPIASAISITGNEDVSISVVLSGSDIDGDTLTYSVLTQPVNGVLSGVAPNLTYTPNTDYNGADSFTFKTNDGLLDSVSAMVSITIVAVNDAPVAINQNITTNEDNAVTVVLVAADADADVMTYQLVSQPLLGTITGSAPNLIYTPNENANGTDSFTFKASDGLLDSAIATVSINVTAVNDAPVANDLSITGAEDTPTIIALPGTDVDADSLSYQIINQPMHGSLSGSAPNLTYTGNSNFNGLDSFSYLVNDGLLDSAPATVSITLTATNDAPVATAQTINTDEDTAANIILSGSDIDGDLLTFSVTTQPLNGVLSGIAPDLSYTPDANFSGADSFTFTVNDGLVDSAAVSVSITVTASNDVPLATAQTINTNEDTAVTVVLTGSDVDGDSLTYSISTQPLNGVLSGIAPDLSYTPNGNFNGSDSFSFVVNDGQTNSAAAIVSITINAVNDAPVALAQTVTTNEDTAATVDLSASDVDGDTLTYQIATQPAYGVITGVAPNLIYTPDGGVNGTDSFTYFVNDGLLDSTTVTVSITVLAINDAPVANNQVVSTSEDVIASIVLFGTDIEGDTLSYQVLTQPANGVLSGVAPFLSYTPNTNFYGTDSFTFVVNDGLLSSPAATVSINIDSVNDAPVVTDQVIATNAGVAATITLSGVDIENDTLSFSVVSQPLNGSLSGVAPNLVYTSNTGFTGSDSFTYISNDGADNSAAATVSITVLTVNAIPVANNQALSANENTALAITLSGSDADNDPLTYQLVSQPAQGSLSGIAPNLTYTPATNYEGIDSFIFIVNDGKADSALATVDITVIGINEAPVIHSKPVLFGVENKPYRYQIEASDADGDALSFVLTTNATGAVFDVSSQSIIWDTPVIGSYSVVLEVADTAGLSVQQVYTLQVVSELPIVTAQGTDFWFTFFSNTCAPVYTVNVSSNETADFTVEIPGLAYSSNHVVTSNSLTTVDLSAQLSDNLLTSKLGLHSNAVHVIASAPVSVYLRNRCAGASMDTALVYPVKALGTQYQVISWAHHLSSTNNTGSVNFANELGVVATEDNTLVTINPSVDSTDVPASNLTRPANVAFQVNLNKGDVYQLRARGWGSELSGTPVIADKPIAFFSGDVCAAVGSMWCDHLVEQIPANNNWGSDYLTVPIAQKIGGDFVRVYASKDDSYIWLNNEIVAYLNQGEFHEMLLKTASEISSNQPVMVAQYARGLQLSSGGDPFMVLVPPSEQFISHYTFVAVPDGVRNNFINVIAPTKSVSSIQIDSSSVDPSLWVPINNSVFSGAQVPVSLGLHNVTGEENFGLTVYGNDLNFESYGHIGGLAFTDNRQAQSLVLSSNNSKPVTGGELCISAQVLDQNNLPVTQSQVFFNRQSGAFNRVYTKLTDITGRAQLCYSAAMAGAETFNISIQSLAETLTVNWQAYTGSENRPPQILSLPVMHAVPNQSYSYQVVAHDPNEDYLQYSLVEAPVGMMIDMFSGLIQWLTLDNFEDAWVSVQVTDAQGAIAQQKYRLQYTPGSNRYPSFTSSPVTRLMSGRLYNYKMTGNDVDGDSLVYRLLSGPVGMTLDADTLSWSPAAQDVGSHEVVVRVEDLSGDGNDQSFTVNVELNLPPDFITEPKTGAITGHDYTYQFKATDDNSDAILYNLISGPAGLKLEPSTPYVRWFPGTNQVGAHKVVLQADDQFGGISLHEFTIVVAANKPPEVSVVSLQTAITGHAYGYRIIASDPDSDSLAYALLSGPQGMTLALDGLGGELRWTPEVYQLGLHQVVIELTDNFGAWLTYSFEIRVVQNQPPVITTSPVTKGITAHRYVYIPQASDPENGARIISLISGPAGMAFNSSHQLIWTPTEQQFGNHPVVLQVDDGLDGTGQQSYVLAITKNATPVFTTQPVTGAKAGVRYRYNPAATDADNDSVRFRLVSGPAGFIALTSNIFDWIPDATQVGKHAVVIEALDTVNGATRQSFNITVIDTELKFTSTPDNQVIFHDELYQFNLTALHPDNATLTFALTQAPAGLTIDALSGLLSWTPALTQIGLHTVIATVSDGAGQTDTASFTIQVAENTNQAPVINSVPVTSAVVDTAYAYAVAATDAENQPISFSLTQSPPGMTINSAGLVQWTPLSADIGNHLITIRAADERSRFSEQTFTLEVQAANQKPIVSGIPATSAAVAFDYHQQLQVTDPDGDSLNYAVLQAPTGVTVDPLTGLVNWTPTTDQVGSHIVSVQIDDGQAFIAVSWTIVVSDVLVPIELFVTLEPQFIQPGEVTTLSVITTGGIAQSDVITTVDGLITPLDQKGQAILEGAISGRHDVVVTATDGVNTESYSTYFSVADPADISAPVVEINSPQGGASITAPTEILATVQDENIAEVLLSYLKPGSTEFVELYRGTDLFSSQLMATFDPTLLMNGLYYLNLQATDINGLTGSTAIPVVVEGDFKVGHFSITLEDINIALAGVPIRVTRTYDSRQRAEQLDFGYGWSIDYQNVKLEESGEPSEGWYQESKNLYFKIDSTTLSFPATCTYPISEKLVTVTLPNGDVEKFTVHAEPVNGSPASVADPDCHLLADRYYSLTFTAEPGTQSTLSSADGINLFLTDVTRGNLTFLGETAAVPITHYALTTREGYVYNLNQNFGIETVIDPNGNSLTYSDAGITHSTGKSINFVRDREGRIIHITDNTGNLLEYAYNSLGDLTASTDALINTTSYTYSQEHALEEIIDPLQRRLVRNIYDLDGRLVAQEDADGVRTSFNHDIAGRVSIVTNRRGYSTQYVYDDRGNVLSETDALQQTTSYTYDADDNQLSKTNALGKTSSATYNEKGDQLTQVDALFNTTTFTYNDFGQELTVTDAKDNVFTNAYDAYGNLLSITDPADHTASNLISSFGLPGTITNTLGYQTHYTYNAQGNKASETDDFGNTITYTYDDNSDLLTETRQRTDNGSVYTETTHYEYDKLNRLIKTIDALSQVTSHEYDLAGNKVRDIDAEARITEYTYDAYSRLTRTDYPDASFSSSTYDAEGNKLTDTDRTGYTTTYVYDELNRLVTTIYDDATRTHIEYDAVGRVKAEIDANNNRTEFEYDDAGRRTLTRDALLNETSFTYDKEGNLTAQTDANLNTTRFEYDALDNRLKTIYPDLSSSSQTYDAMGQVTSRTDQTLKTTAYVYDALGRLTEVTDALLGVTKYTYDEVGNKLTQTDAENKVTRWTYDALGRETSRTLPLQQTDSSSYDVHGNLQSHIDFNGQQTSYLYDTNNRVERIDYNDLTAETFTYDNEGRRTSATDRQGKTQSWVYDNRGRLTLDTKANGDQIAYGYDNAGNRTVLTVTPFNGVAEVTAYGYDTLNRLATVTAPGILITSYTYDNVGNRASVTYPNGNVTSYVYDTLNRLKQQTTQQGTTVLTDFTYTLDASGHRTQITEASGRVTDYTYDDLYRLLTENVTDAVNGNYSATYVYDKVGNRTYSTIDGVQTLFTYDANDRLTQQGGTTYTYDANGNTLTETLDLSVKTFSYDAKNQMVGSDQAGVTSRYAYDVDGLRVEKTEGAVNTSFLVDLNRDYGQVVKETTGVDTVDYTYGDDLISQSRGSNLSYYLYDGLGSTRALSDVSGGVTDTYNYEAFGDTLNKTGVTENNYLFTGEQFDSGLDNYYLRARYYDQNIGRFTQLDTWMGVDSEPVTLNKYIYADANPAHGIDPSGHMTLTGLNVSFAIASGLTLAASANYSSFIGSRGGEGDSYTDRDFGWATITSMLGSNHKLYIMLNSKPGANGDTGSNYEHGVLERDCKNGDNCTGYVIQTNKTAPWSVPKGWVRCSYDCKSYGSHLLRYMPVELGCPSPTAWAPGWYNRPPPRDEGDSLPGNPFRQNN